ncbi:MAG: hypothetical protein KDD44_09340, partial [Bdellovibrionales bacterium]|nr:hypothetical protein [Bdellovibrionales bacterium]
MFRPSGPPRKKDLRDHLATEFRAYARLARECEAKHAHGQLLKMPFGPLSLSLFQCFSLHAAHCERHIRTAERLVEALRVSGADSAEHTG